MGPGTHVVERIKAGLRPTSKVDAIALRHDIDYLTNEEPIISDMRAILATFNNSEVLSYQATVMRLGLGLRSAADLLMHMIPVKNPTHINGRTDRMPITNEELVDNLRNETENW